MTHGMLFPEVGSKNTDVSRIFAKIVIGASGAITTESCRGANWVKHGNTGQYTVTLLNSFAHLLGFTWGVQHTAGGSAIVQVESEDVDNATAPTLTVQAYNASDGTTAVDLPDGSTLFVEFALSSSTTLGIA